VDHAHLCPFCGWHRPARSATMLAPACERCGGTLRAVDAAALEEERREDAVGHVPVLRSDSTALLAALLVVPWLLPLAGVELADVVYGVPLVLLAFATVRLWRAGREDPETAGVHRALAVSCAAGATASAVAIVAAVTGDTVGAVPFYAGLAASCAILVAALGLARDPGTSRRWAPLADAGLLALVLTAVVVWFVVVPGLRDGDAALTAVVLVDLVAAVVVALAAVARTRGRRAAAWLAAGCVLLVAGDGLVCAAAAGQLPELTWLTALLWAAAGFAFAAVGDIGFAERRTAPDGELSSRRWLAGRVALPLTAVLAFPAIAGALAVAGRLTTGAAVFFGALGLAALVVAFVRQAQLLLDDRNAVVRERAMRHEATRRNEELEALTGLATTMTQTLEEAPIVEQALGVLRAAARATSAALHLEADDGGARLAAAVGRWGAERTWAPDAPLGDEPVLTVRGRRAVLRLPLVARGRRIGAVTLIRPEQEPFDPHGVELLELLVGQMAVAVQNARDYREKLEQAIRDPLTGLYNRRFLLEALEKEVQRAERYGSEASLVLFDVDDFKQINDTYGHAGGDDVLRAIAEVAGQVVRPSDSFARIGGEEFALLLPETTQLEALLAADRLRTAVARRTILPDRKVTLSGGVASCPGDAVTADDLQRRADAALYWAKRNGKDLCSVASEAALDGEAGTGSDGLVAHLHALVAMIDARELHTRDHSENVATYAVAIGQEAGLDRERIVALRRAAMLHDVGKIAVRTEILEKPGRLTEAEFAEIQRHAVAGGIMLAHAGLVDEASWVRHHHERVDGTGYPDGLAGDDLPLEARILFVADAFEAMTSDRPYRAGMAPAAALAELRRCAGTQFDARIVELLAGLVESGRLAVMALRHERPAAA
jgi:diguanylate cyclase (GGDEF)-like protein